jgi:hypothetical protein
VCVHVIFLHTDEKGGCRFCFYEGHERSCVCVCACLSALAKVDGVGWWSRCSDCWVAGGEGQKEGGRHVYMLGRGWNGNEKSTSWEADLVLDAQMGSEGRVALLVQYHLCWGFRERKSESRRGGWTAQDGRGSYARQVLCSSKCKVGKGQVRRSSTVRKCCLMVEAQGRKRMDKVMDMAGSAGSGSGRRAEADVCNS